MSAQTNSSPLREKRIHQAFEIGVILKGLNALVEIILGVALLFALNVGHIVIALAQNELLEDPGDFFARNVDKFATYLTPQFQLYAALYLLSHGVVKAVLVWGLLRRKLWAYPASLAVLTLFILYQVIKWLGTHSVTLALLTLFDLLVMWLIWHEYRTLSGRQAAV